MEIKMFEIRDKGTFIPALAVQLPMAGPTQDMWLLERAGYAGHARYILLCKIDGGSGHCSCDPYEWGQTRTMSIAHQWIITHWDELPSGSVICVETLLGERATPVPSERLLEKEF